MRRLTLAAFAAAAFLATRLFLLLRRDPDIDELFTVWIARKDFASLLATLRHDSGPPLYYALLQLLPDSLLDVTSARMLSMAFALAALALVLTRAGDAISGAFAALLLAVYPQHLYFSTNARAYALAALAIGVAVIALDRWAESGSRKALLAGVMAILITAYSHYYGVYFFPLPLAFAGRARWRDGVVATAAIALLFVPGFLLMRAQPPSVLAWMRIDDDLLRVWMVAQSALRIGFDARQPMPFELLVRIVSAALLLAALFASRKSPRALRLLLAVVVPIAGALFAAAVGVTAYFPLRFESVLSIPVVLWFVCALRSHRSLLALAFVVGLCGSLAMLARDYTNGSPIYRAATFVRDARLPVAASGLTYIEASALCSREVIAFPRKHAVHPSLAASRKEALRDFPALPGEFIWAGEVDSVAFAVLREHCALQPMAAYGPVVVVRCGNSSAAGGG